MLPVSKQSCERKHSLYAHPEQLLMGFQIACQTSGLCRKSIASGFYSITEVKLDPCGAKCNLAISMELYLSLQIGLYTFCS